MDWDEYFINLAEHVSKRSIDPNTKHGCVLVDPDKRIISTGYNGPIQGLNHHLVELTRPHKYKWFIHAEDNAVLFARRDLRGCTAYITGHPCGDCFRRLVQAGVRKIVHGQRTSACITESDRQMIEVVCMSLGVTLKNIV